MSEWRADRETDQGHSGFEHDHQYRNAIALGGWDSRHAKGAADRKSVEPERHDERDQLGDHRTDSRQARRASRTP
jgi:hypothetical protein